MKKWLMKQIWRVQQSQMVISILFWSLTLTGVFYEHLKWYITHYFGIEGLIGGMVVLFAIVLLCIVLFGFLYDAIFKMWHAQMVVVAERNQYAQYQMFPKEVTWFKEFYLPLAKAVNNIKEDKELSEAIEKVEDWVKDGDMRGPPTSS